MTPLAGLRSDGGVILREVVLPGGFLRVEVWHRASRTWLPTGRSVYDYDTLPLPTDSQLDDAGL